MSTKTPLMLVAALTTVGLATAVGAQPVYTPQSNPDQLAEKVSLKGLDLHSERGAKLALYRIREAAKDVCGIPPGDSWPIWIDTRPSPCVSRAVDRAVAALDEPVVTAVNDNSKGRSSAQLATRGR